MSGREKLLVEVGTEELPPRILQTLARAFAAELARGLIEAGVLDAPGNYSCFATPRRLAALIDGVAAAQPRRIVERRGPSLSAAFDDAGKPTRAGAGFAKSCGVKVSQLEKLETGKGAWLVCRQPVAAKKLSAIVTECMQHALRKLPAPKRMRWGNSEAEFVRPAHWLLALHGARVVSAEALGMRATRYTRGHRFHANHKIALPNAGAYEKILEKEGMVIAGFDKRRAKIKTQLDAAARKHSARAIDDADLLDLVTGMVEWPQALVGEFDRRYLKLPPEALVSVMRDHQKYFPLRDEGGKLLPAFVAVSNIKSKTPAQVRRGNERVLRARLADAEFFLGNDLKVSLAWRYEQLKGVLFHQRLGTLHDKSSRIAVLAAEIAEKLSVDRDQVIRAAHLCKVDLASDMVGEFPELQGIIGRYCAVHHGEDRTVAAAIEQHYWPRHAGDKLPRDAVAQCIALADRLDSLMSLFLVSETPSGDKDPFALRRAALGVLRIVIEKQLDIDVVALMNTYHERLIVSPQLLDPKVITAVGKKTVHEVFDFMLDRLKAHYQLQGFRADEISAVLACRPHKPLDFDRRIKALSRFFKNRAAAAESLAAANKRIANILNKTDAPPQNYRRELLHDAAEIALADEIEKVGAHVEECFGANRYDDGLAALAKLKQPVDTFFDEVMVMEKDAEIRENRLALLRRIRALFLAVADISLMRSERG